MAIKYLDDTGLARLVSDVKSYVGTQIGAIPNISYEVVLSLPTAGATYYFNTSKTVYLAPKSTSQTNNSYDEYICTRSGTEVSYTYAWEKIGDTQIDLSNYVTLNGAQTITATKTFTTSPVLNNGIYLRGKNSSGTERALIAINSSNVVVLGNSNGNIRVYTSTYFSPAVDATKNLGTASYRWKDFYLTGQIKDGNNTNYGLVCPAMTSWTANKTIATTDDVSVKLDKSNSTNVVYVNGSNGTPTTLSMSTTGTAWSIARYNSSGVLYTATPSENTDAANKQYVDNGLSAKQDALVSGTNIKTINNESILGSGNISISGGSATDVQINGTSITSNNVADIQTNTAYNASSNKIATMSDFANYYDKTQINDLGSINFSGGGYCKNVSSWNNVICMTWRVKTTGTYDIYLEGFKNQTQGNGGFSVGVLNDWNDLTENGLENWFPRASGKTYEQTWKWIEVNEDTKASSVWINKSLVYDERVIICFGGTADIQGGFNISIVKKS